MRVLLLYIDKKKKSFCCTFGTNPEKHCRKYKDDAQNHAEEACRPNHKLTSASRVHPQKYACIQKPKDQTKRKKQTQRHSKHISVSTQSRSAITMWLSSRYINDPNLHTIIYCKPCLAELRCSYVHLVVPHLDAVINYCPRSQHRLLT